MTRFLALSFGVLLFASTSARAQDYVVESSDPASGTAGVATSAKITFEFSDWVNVETDWNTAFIYEPHDALTVKQFNLVLDDEGNAAVAEFIVEQAPNTDYTWLIYDVQKPERLGGDLLAEPHVLRYSTSSTIGDQEVSGAVTTSSAKAFAQRGAAAGALRRDVWRQLTGMAETSGLGRPVFDAAPAPPPRNDEQRGGPIRWMDASKAGAKAGGEPARDATSIFLLKRFSGSASAWSVEAGTMIEGSSGSYAIEHVRDGTYWPLAVRYADQARTNIEALGFYDANGDGAPDPITTSGSGRGGIDLTLVPFPRTTARDNLTAAEAAAEVIAGDQRLLAVRGDASTETGGTAYTWTYQYYSPSENRETVVTVDPIGASTRTQAAFDYIRTMSSVGPSFVDSDEALQAALNDGGQQLVDACPAGDLDVAVEIGNLYWLVDYPTSAVFWRVRLEGTTGPSSPSAEDCNQVFERYLDVENGDMLDPSALPVELVGFEAQADGDGVLLQWETVSETDNAGFAVEHAAPGATAFASLDFVDGVGTSSALQQYSYRAAGLVPGRHRFRLRQVDVDGAVAYSPEVEATVTLQQDLVVKAAYPNPFSDRATVRVGLREGGTVTVALFDALGRRVREVYAGHLAAGQLQPIRVNGRGLASGRYYVRVVSQDGQRAQVQPVTVVR